VQLAGRRTVTPLGGAGQRDRRAVAPEMRGPLVTTLCLVGLELASQRDLEIPPAAIVLMLLAVVYSSFLGGLRAGLVSAAITLAYGFAFFGGPVRPLVYSPENALQLLLLTIAAPTMAIMVGALKSRLEQTATGAERLERDYRLLLDSLDDGLAVSDERGRLVDMNPRLCVMTGFPRSELLGSEPPYPYWDPETAGTIEASLRRTLAGERVETDATYRRRDGSRFPVIVGRAPVVDGDGGVVGSISVVKDVSERREGEERVRRAEERVRQAQKMEAVGRLAGGVAHDFNNLLTAIVGYTDLLREDLRGGPLEREIEELGTATDRATALTRRLLAISRQQTFEAVIVDVNSLVRGMEPILRRLVGDGVTLELTLDPALHPVRGDRVQLEQVLLNLVVNARDAMPDGGQVRIHTSNVPGPIGPPDGDPAAVLAGVVRLSVHDDGAGIDESAREHLFEPFFTTKPHGKGTGLGLATVYAAATQAGGWVDVESRVGEGSTFHVYLPAADPSADQPRARQEAVADAHGSERVLVVEDTPAVRALAVEVLRRHGYQVVDAADVDEALAVLEHESWNVNLIVTDVVMPGRSGAELVTIVRERLPALPVVFMSGYLGDAGEIGPLPSGASRFLQKPFAPHALAGAVRALLDESARSRS
jgi:PAS domain S-box-containing protein